MSRQLINRLLIVFFVIIMFFMGGVYMRQENKIKNLQAEQQALEEKKARIEYMINEYNILIENLDSRNYIIRMARDMFGWVFEDEIIYKKPVGPDISPSTPAPEMHPDS